MINTSFFSKNSANHYGFVLNSAISSIKQHVSSALHSVEDFIFRPRKGFNERMGVIVTTMQKSEESFLSSLSQDLVDTPLKNEWKNPLIDYA